MPNVDINGTVVSFPDDMQPDQLKQAVSSAASKMGGHKPSLFESLKSRGKIGLEVAKQFGKYESNPQNLARMAGPYLPALGGAVGSAINPGMGSAIGAGLGSIAGNMASIYGGDKNAPTTPGSAAKEAMINTLVSGFPDTTQAGKLAQLGRKGIAKTFEAVAGPKANVYEQAMRQGLKTYTAPSMEEAEQGFENALTKEGIGRPPVQNIYDPQLAQARDTAKSVMEKVRSGPLVKGISPVNPEEALRGKQAIDRIIAATPQGDKGALTEMYKDRDTLNDILSNVSGPLSDASKNYRQAIVKKSLMSPLRVTKAGKPSAFITILSALDALGANSLKPLAYPLATGPAATGLAATAGGDIMRLLSKPGVRQAITAEILRRQRNQPNENPNPQQ
jgi:hypothetical protein